MQQSQNFQVFAETFGKYYQQIRQVLATTVSQAPSAILGAFVYPGHTFGFTIQAREIPTLSWGSVPPVATGSL